MWLKTGWGGRVQRFLQCWASWHKLNGYLTCQVASQLMSHTLMQQRQWRRKMNVAVSRTLFFGCCLTDESNVSVCCVEDKVKADEQPTVRLQSAVIQERKNTIWHNQGLHLQKTKTRGKKRKCDIWFLSLKTLCFCPERFFMSSDVEMFLRRHRVSLKTRCCLNGSFWNSFRNQTCAIDGSSRLWHELFFSLAYFRSVAEWRVRPPVAEWDMNVYLKHTVRWVSVVVFYCGITLVLFTTDQKNTVYKWYIDIY